VRRRNEATAAGDLFAAWRENRILETFYAPVLDPPGSLSPAGFRWPAEQRVDIERRAQDDGRPYRSAAEPYPIFVWPKSTFWIAIALVIAVTGAVAVAADRKSRRPPSLNRLQNAPLVVPCARRNTAAEETTWQKKRRSLRGNPARHS